MNKLASTVEPLFISKVMFNALVSPVNPTIPSSVLDSQTHMHTPSRMVTYNDMVKSIIGSGDIDRTWLMKEVNKTLTSRRAYRALLKRLSFSYSGLQVAASSDNGFSSRSNAYFTIDFKRDKTFNEQVYVLLSIVNPLARHLNTPIELHIIDKDHVGQLHFSALIDGKSQQLLEVNDQLMESLLNSDSELFIY